jgi:hypothetical protein
MIRASAAVRVHCSKCKNFFDVDLVAVRNLRGETHSLIDAWTTCRLSSCRGRGYFVGAASLTSTFILLVRADLARRAELEQLRPIDVEGPDGPPAPPPAPEFQAVA